jgi:hypothetical protein
VIILDTDRHELVCSWCETVITSGDPLVIYGVGSPRYLKVYHPVCDHERLTWINDLPTPRAPFLP